MKVWQSLVGSWQKLVFGPQLKNMTPRVYSLRIVEEAMELAREEGISIAQINAVRDQVYNAPMETINPVKEYRDLLIVTTGYAVQKRIDMEDEFLNAFSKIMDPVVIERVRFRNSPEGDKVK